MIIIESISGGIRLTDTTTGEQHDLAGDAERQRLGDMIRQLATQRYASGHSHGLDDGYKRARQDQERAERQGPQIRARLALN